MRLLFDSTGHRTPGDVLDDAGLLEVYASPARRWLRANFVTSLDGAVTGADHRSGSVNTHADHKVFDLLRRQSDVVVVGAGTVRAEGYPSLRSEDPKAPTLVVVSHSGALPRSVGDGPPGSVLLVTRRNADQRAVAASCDLIGEEFVIRAGGDSVDLQAMRHDLEDKGFRQILCEGGPQLFGSLLTARVVDELDLTWSPLILGGEHKTLVSGPDMHVSLSPMALVEEDGTVLGRWRVSR
jgi:riboflavin biosynthesis pyrimidine reductase